MRTCTPCPLPDDSWHELDRALLEYRPLIGVANQFRVHTPRAIAKRMMEYHLDRDYTMWVAEHLGNPEERENL